MKKFYHSIRKMRKVTVEIVAIAMVFGVVFSTVTVSATTLKENSSVQTVNTTDNSETSYNTRSALKDSMLEGGGGNEYSTRIWSSLSEAKAYYGYDFDYGTCNVYYGGIRYNHYYSFSDNTRCYFKVLK